ncbi:hypothetical protein D048_4632 [Vibrio parahaemolyticus VPTS-2009]|nr:hypothetical protein D048_4632 [Vibrio parahaemolyticus VPTS-2009]
MSSVDIWVLYVDSLYGKALVVQSWIKAMFSFDLVAIA